MHLSCEKLVDVKDIGRKSVPSILCSIGYPGFTPHIVVPSLSLPSPPPSPPLAVRQPAKLGSAPHRCQ